MSTTALELRTIQFLLMKFESIFTETFLRGPIKAEQLTFRRVSTDLFPSHSYEVEVSDIPLGDLKYLSDARQKKLMPLQGIFWRTLSWRLADHLGLPAESVRVFTDEKPPSSLMTMRHKIPPRKKK